MSYWIISLALIAFGFLAALSIGQPFLMVGLAMLVLGPFRRRPLIFWPPLLAVIAYNLTYFAVAPFYCTASSFNGGPSTTVCSSLIGIRYAGEGIYNPSLTPAVLTGLAVAGVTAVVTFMILLWRRRLPPRAAQ
jgi:hypothetical protein